MVSWIHRRILEAWILQLVLEVHMYSGSKLIVELHGSLITARWLWSLPSGLGLIVPKDIFVPNLHQDLECCERESER